MIFKFLILLFALSFQFNGFVDGNESDVPQLTDDDFDSSINQYETALIMFYAPW